MSNPIADSLQHDPRIAQGKALILDALKEHQQRITGIRAPEPGLTDAYHALLQEFGALRAGSLYYPYLGSGIGAGPFVELADGSVKYDFISGIGVHHLGHSHLEIVEAAIDAAIRDTVMQGNLQQDQTCVELAKALVTAANSRGADLKHCFFTTSGAMANENALKIIFQKRYPAHRLLAFEGCFAGRSLALCQVTDKPAYREGLPDTLAVDYIPFFDPDLPEESTARAVAHLKRHLERYPGKHAAMVFELVQGEGGFYPGDTAFFEAIVGPLRERNIAIMVDEIQTFGRTSQPFAYQHFGLDRFVEVVTVGKLLQACATLFTDEYRPAAGLLSQTFTASTAAIFTARAILRVLLQGDFFGPDGWNTRLHDHFVKRLREIKDRHPGLIEGPYGIGAMVAFTPFNGDPAQVKRLIHALFHNGVIAFYCGSAISRVRFLVPAGAVTTDHVDEVMSIVEKTLPTVAQ